MKKYLAIFKQRWFWQLLGLVALGLLIWFVGPLISVGSVAPLAGLWTRIIVIAVLLLLLVGSWLWRRWQATKKARAMEAELVGAEEDDADGADAQLNELQERFTSAVELLKKSRKGKRDLSERWLYELPWYVIIGPPGSGKTTLLANSDLEFPLAGELGQDGGIEIKGIGGTRNCDWFFTNDAVLLDTAGRYTTQGSAYATAGEEWLGFLDLLKRHRSRRPINGVLVAMSLADLISQSEAERREQALAVRQRILELHERLKVRFPVYLLITKCDLLSGFVEFFEDMGKDERAQVWGYTFKLADAGEGVDVTGRALEELDLLVDRLNSQVCGRMNDERSLTRRTRIFGFPQQMASLRGALGDFLKSAFKPNRFQQPPLLRGVYFTSGTQEGAPVDRLLRDLADSYGLDRAAPAGIGGAGGRSYFINRVFNRIVFPEANLVGTDPKAERRRRWLRGAAYASIAGLSIALVLGWIWSYGRNQAALADVRNHAERYEDVEAAAPMNTTDFVALSQPLNELERAAARFPASAPLTMRLGLYQGPRVTPSTEDAYERVLATRLLASVGERMRELLRADSPPALLAGRLKAYLMLGFPERLEPEHVQAVMAEDWATFYPNDPELRADLERHLARMLAEGYDPLPMDQALVLDARKRLAEVEAWEVIYDLIKERAAQEERHDYELVDLLGRDGDLVFTSSMGDLDAVAIPGLYTLKGYQNVFGPESRRLVEQVADDAWVYHGEESREDQFRADVMDELTNQYTTDYIDAWRSALRSLRVRPTGSIHELVEQVELASGPGSPLRQVVEKASSETRPAAAAEAQLAAGEAAAAAGSAVEVAAQMNTGVQVARQRAKKLKRAMDQAGVEADLFGKAQTDALQRVDNRFLELHELTETRRDDRSDLDLLLIELDELYRFLREFSESGDPDRQAFGELQQVLQGADSPARNLNRRAKRLPSPVRAWITALGDGGAEAFGDLAQQGLEERWRDEIYDFCQTAIAGRYPFNRGASLEVKLTDFGRFFGVGGKLEQFFEGHLKPLVDTTTTPWSWRSISGTDFRGGTESLAQIERAGRIRAAFFPAGGQKPAIEFSITPVTLANAARTTLSIDGQLLEYEHNPVRPEPFSWPAPGGAGYARLEFLAMDGRSASLSASGDWAWFRLLDRARRSVRRDDSIQATFSKGAQSLRLELRANSVFNPFNLPDLKQFRCVPNL